MGEADVKRSRSVRSRDVLAWSALLIAAAAVAARYTPVVNHAVLIIAALSPYLVWGAAVSAVLLLMNRRRWSAALALLLLAAAVLPAVPQFLDPGHPPADSIPVRVLTANLRDGRADPESVAAAAREHADLLLVQELSPQLAQTLSDRYLTTDFPYQVLNPGDYAVGVGIWSRYPIVQTSLVTTFTLGGLTATVRPPGAADLIVASVHVVGPWPQPVDHWREEIAALPETMEHLAAAAGHGAAIVAGDLNATADHKPFRRLLDTGYRDAGRQFGFAATYPADMAVPPLIRIDHVLTYNSTATDTHAVRIAGSDHLALGTTVHIPR
jgi:endonuclease/exonuclease/phosphatase (EEP) superfamily protein YafD